MSRLLLRAYWPPRRESADDCTDRLQGFLAGLADCDPAFAAWFETGWSRKQALARPVDRDDRTVLRRIMEEGRHRRDIGREIVHELGFQIGLWNGADDDAAVGLNIACGLYRDLPNPRDRMTNSVLLDLPPVPGRLERSEVLSHVLAAVITHREPERAGVMRREGMEARGFDAYRVFVDWMVYMPERIERVPEPSVVVPVESGTIIVVTPSPPSLDRAEDQDAIRAIERIVLD